MVVMVTMVVMKNDGGNNGHGGGNDGDICGSDNGGNADGDRDGGDGNGDNESMVAAAIVMIVMIVTMYELDTVLWELQSFLSHVTRDSSMASPSLSR